MFVHSEINKLVFLYVDIKTVDPDYVFNFSATDSCREHSFMHN